MEQIFAPLIEEKAEKTKDLKNFKNEFDQIGEKLQTADRIVTLRYQSCCGCGCSDYKFNRTVPFDSPLQDGDRVESMTDTDWENEIKD